MNSGQADPILKLYRDHQAQFDLYRDLLLKWNETINLTAITAPDQIREFHFLDSLFLVPHLTPIHENVSRETFSLLDIGSGPGLPGMAIKIVCPDLQVTLVDAVKKKCDFMKAVIRALGLTNIQVLHRTIKEGEAIGQFDFIVSRATFKMAQFIKMAMANLVPDGKILAMKGFEVMEEMKACQVPIQEFVYTLPCSQQRRKVLVITKCFT